MSACLSLMCNYCQGPEECHVILSNITPNNQLNFLPIIPLSFSPPISLTSLFDLCPLFMCVLYPSLLTQSTFRVKVTHHQLGCFTANIKHSSTMVKGLSLHWSYHFLISCFLLLLLIAYARNQSELSLFWGCTL